MTDLTRAQKTRLGLFILLALGLFVLAALVKIGPQLFGKHDPYHVRMPNGVGGLQAGATVTLNGLVVGSVKRIGIDPNDVAIVAIELSIDGGTPIPEDAKATVVMQGITGSRNVELAGGTHAARRRAPGEEIPAGLSIFDELAERARGIAERVERLLETAQSIAGGPEGEHIRSIIAHADRMVGSLDALVAETGPHITAIIARVDEVSARIVPAVASAGDDVGVVMADARAAIVAVRKTAETLQGTIERVAREEVGPLFARVTDVAAQADQLVARASGLLGRAQADLRTTLDSMVRGMDSFSDLADMLRSDPSSVVLGRSATPRELP